MQKNLLARALLGLAIISAIGNAGLAWLNVTTRAEGEAVRVRSNQLNEKKAMAQGLVRDTLEYAAKNPAIDPVLKVIGIERKPAQPAPVAPQPRR